jgi:hypothetical protein
MTAVPEEFAVWSLPVLLPRVRTTKEAEELLSDVWEDGDTITKFDKVSGNDRSLRGAQRDVLHGQAGAAIRRSRRWNGRAPLRDDGQ